MHALILRMQQSNFFFFIFLLNIFLDFIKPRFI